MVVHSSTCQVDVCITGGDELRTVALMKRLRFATEMRITHLCDCQR